MSRPFEAADPRSGIRDPGSEIRDPRSGIRDPGSGSGIRDLAAKSARHYSWSSASWPDRSGRRGGTSENALTVAAECFPPWQYPRNTMNKFNRREFIQRTTLAFASGATLLPSGLGFAADTKGRQMTMDLVCGAIGVSANQREAAELA